MLVLEVKSESHPSDWVIRTELRSDLVKKSTLLIVRGITIVKSVRTGHQESEAPSHGSEAIHKLFDFLSPGHDATKDIDLKTMMMSLSKWINENVFLINFTL